MTRDVNRTTIFSRLRNAISPIGTQEFRPPNSIRPLVGRNRGRGRAHGIADLTLPSASRNARSRLSVRLQRTLRRGALGALCLFLLALPASAKDGLSAFGDPPPAGAAAAPASTRIEVDRQANVIRFIINGREGMFLDSSGLHVRGNIEYGGDITDYGVSGFEADVKSKHEGRRR